MAWSVGWLIVLPRNGDRTTQNAGESSGRVVRFSETRHTARWVSKTRPTLRPSSLCLCGSILFPAAVDGGREQDASAGVYLNFSQALSSAAFRSLAA